MHEKRDTVDAARQQGQRGRYDDNDRAEKRTAHCHQFCVAGSHAAGCIKRQEAEKTCSATAERVYEAHPAESRDVADQPD